MRSYRRCKVMDIGQTKKTSVLIIFFLEKTSNKN